MEGMELISFKIISAVGEARSCYIEAIREAKKGNFEKADALIEEGAKVFIEGHHAHSELVQQEAAGDPVVPTLMLMHAEDQLMSADGFKIIAQEFIDLYKNLYSK